MVVKNSCGQTITQYNVQTGDAVNNLNQVAPAAAGTVLTSNGVAAQPSFQAISSPSPNETVTLVDDFLCSQLSTSSAINSQISWRSANMSLAIGSNGTSAHPGTIDSGLLNSGISYMISGPYNTSIILGGGEVRCNWVFKINTLSDGTNRYILNIGLGDLITGTDQNNGAYFRYVENVNSGNWQILTAAAGSPTTTSTATAVTTGWHNAGIVINAAGSSAEFFMDGVSLGTINTTLPTLEVSPTYKLGRQLGSIAVGTISLDLMYININLTTPR